MQRSPSTAAKRPKRRIPSRPFPKRAEGPTVDREPRPRAKITASPAFRLPVKITHAAAPVVKENASQSGPYMTAAKALGYCMRCGRPTTGHGGLDFCHADLGKGIGLKTDVRRGWPGCRSCHETVGRELARAVRRAVEIMLGAMTRAEVLAAGSWPKRLPMWELEEARNP